VFKIISTFRLGFASGGFKDLLVSDISAGNRLSGPDLDYVASIFGRSKECLLFHRGSTAPVDNECVTRALLGNKIDEE
jgi:hypothetical protein